MLGWLILSGAIALVVAISAVQYRRGARQHRSLASRRPEAAAREVPLGMEATDLKTVARIARANQRFERNNLAWVFGKSNRFLGDQDRDIEQAPEDHSYAAWFHRSFMKNKDK